MTHHQPTRSEKLLVWALLYALAIGLIVQGFAHAKPLPQNPTGVSIFVLPPSDTSNVAGYRVRYNTNDLAAPLTSTNWQRLPDSTGTNFTAPFTVPSVFAVSVFDTNGNEAVNTNFVTYKPLFAPAGTTAKAR